MLEELKEIRSEAVKLSSRVGKFKSELEDVMQDDSDMLVLPCVIASHKWDQALQLHTVLVVLPCCDFITPACHPTQTGITDGMHGSRLSA